MRITIAVVAAFVLSLSNYAQLNLKNLEYNVLASAQRDSVQASSPAGTITKEPKYIGGASLLQKKLNETLAFDKWKKKKAGTYTVYVTQNWKQVSVSADTKKAKDIDLVTIATALKQTAPRWSSLMVGDTSIARYTLMIQFELVKL